MHRYLDSLKRSSSPNAIAEQGIEVIETLLSQAPQRFKKLDTKEISELAGEISLRTSSSSELQTSTELDSKLQTSGNLELQPGLIDSIGLRAQDDFFSSYLFDPFT